MPESRDRLLRRNDDVAEMYSRRRAYINRTGIIPDNDDSERIMNQTPFRWGSTPLTGGGSGQLLRVAFSTRPIATRGGTGRGLFGTPATVYRRGSRSQNTPPSGSGLRRGRGGARTGSRSSSSLPSWYPRTPLGDITAISRVLESRRERLGNGEGQTPTPIRVYQQPADQDPSPSGAQLEHEHRDEVSLVTPKPKLLYKTFKPSLLGKLPMILADIGNQDGGESGFLTPQKKLLNLIDIVEKAVMEDFNRMKRTPSAKRAERQKRVRTLMSMR